MKAREQLEPAAGGASGAPGANDKLHSEAKSLFAALCGQLDALSHYHFTPRPVVAEMEVRPNVPSIAIEEVLPITMGGGGAMASAREVYASEAGAKRKAAGNLQGQDEAARGQKRRAIKKHQREKQRDGGALNGQGALGAHAGKRRGSGGGGGGRGAGERKSQKQQELAALEQPGRVTTASLFKMLDTGGLARQGAHAPSRGSGGGAQDHLSSKALKL